MDRATYEDKVRKLSGRGIYGSVKCTCGNVPKLNIQIDKDEIPGSGPSREELESMFTIDGIVPKIKVSRVGSL